MLLINPLVILAATGIGYAVCAAAGWNSHPREMFAAAIACLIASELAIIPLILVRGATQTAVAQAALVGTVVHLFACAALGGGAILIARSVRLDGAFVYWLLALYWLTLIVLVMMFVRAVKSAAADKTAAVSVKDSIRTGLQP
jgi:hypothetical protein